MVVRNTMTIPIFSYFYYKKWALKLLLEYHSSNFMRNITLVVILC
jgi:hypothetical protein